MRINCFKERRHRKSERSLSCYRSPFRPSRGMTQNADNSLPFSPRPRQADPRFIAEFFRLARQNSTFLREMSGGWSWARSFRPPIAVPKAGVLLADTGAREARALFEIPFEVPGCVFECDRSVNEVKSLPERRTGLVVFLAIWRTCAVNKRHWWCLFFLKSSRIRIVLLLKS